MDCATRWNDAMMLDRRSFVIAAAVLAACGQGSVAPDDPRPRSYAMLNEPAAPFTLPKLGGGEASLADYAGRALILAFGGLWCPDCILDAPYMTRLAELAESDADVEFLEIHTRNRFGRWGPNDRSRAGATPYDAEESAAALNAYFEETGHSYPVAFDAIRDWAGDAYKIEWYPTYLIIDRAGVIAAWRTDLSDMAGAEAFFAEAKRIAAG